MNQMWSWMPHDASVAIYAMVVACLLPLVFAYAAKCLGGFRMADNAHPREFLTHLSGMAARANAAQQNSYENLPIFLAAVIVAMMFFVPQVVINQLACLYVLIRIGYGLAYIFDAPMFRSVLWALSLACCLLLFFLTIRIFAG